MTHKTPTVGEIAEEVARLASEIDTLFADVHPAVQGGVLALITSRWLSGYVGHEQMREIYESHSRLIWDSALEMVKFKNESQH